MGYDVGVYDSYGQCTITCSGFLRISESSEPYGDRRVSTTLSGNHKGPVRCLRGGPTISD